jgi:hypothetical protein
LPQFYLRPSCPTTFKDATRPDFQTILSLPDCDWPIPHTFSQAQVFTFTPHPQDIQDLFDKQGAMVTYIHMPVFPDSKRCRGFATVTFTKREYVQIALEMDGTKLKGGRWLQVAELDKSKLKKSKGKKQAPPPVTEPAAQSAGMRVLVPG